MGNELDIRKLKNVSFNHTLKQYEKKYRHKKEHLIILTRQEVIDFDKRYKYFKSSYDDKKYELNEPYYLLKDKKWWYIKETDSFYEVPRPVRCLWFINLPIALHALIGLALVGSITTAIVLPIVIVDAHKKLLEVNVEGEFKDRVLYSYLLNDNELKIEINATEDDKKVSEIETIKIKDNFGERELKSTDYTIIETDRGLEIHVKKEVLNNTDGYVVITVVPSVIGEKTTLTKIEVSNSKEYFVKDTISNTDDFTIQAYYDNGESKHLKNGFAVTPSLPYTFQMEDKEGKEFKFEYSNKTATITLTPKVHVTGVTLSKTELTLEKGDTFDLASCVTVLPEEATNKNVTWGSSNPKIVTVDENGLLKAVDNGDAVITVKTVDGGYTAECKVKVSTSIVYHKVTFMVNGTQYGETVEVEDKKLLSRPDVDPTVINKIFKHWSSDTKYPQYNPFDFDNTPIESDLTLNAVFIDNYLTYEDSNKGCKKVTGIIGHELGDRHTIKNIIIPQSVIMSENGKEVLYTVDSIEDYAFTGIDTWTDDYSIYSAVIPNSVKKIGMCSFGSNWFLTDIEFQKGSKLEEISWGCFNHGGCMANIEYGSIFSINLSDCKNLLSIGNQAFYGVTKDKTFILPSSLKTIGQYCLTCDNEVETYVLPASIESIGYTAFCDCGYLTTIDLTAFTDPTKLPSVGASEGPDAGDIASFETPNQMSEGTLTFLVANEEMKSAFMNSSIEPYNWASYKESDGYYWKVKDSN